MFSDIIILMNTYTLGDVKSGLNGKIQGRIGMLISPTNVVAEASRQIIKDLKPSSSATQTKITPFYKSNGGSFAFLPDDLNGKSIRGLYDEIDGVKKDVVLTFEEDLTKFFVNSSLAIVENNGQKYIKTNFSFHLQGKEITPFSTISNVSISGSGTNLDRTSSVVIDGFGGSFDLQNDSNTNITITSTNTLGDLSSFLELAGRGLVFQFYTLNGEGITSIDVVLGSDDSNYITYTGAVRSFRGGRNTVAIDLESGVETGTVDKTNIAYSKIIINKTANKQAINSLILSDFYLGESNRYRLPYYSTQIWQSSEGIKKIKPTEDDDFVVCEDSFFDALVYRAAIIAANEVDMTINSIKMMEGAYKDAKMDHPVDDSLMVMSPSDMDYTNTSNLYD